MANSPARSALDVGSVISDTYVLERLLGRGGMGSVYAASHKRLPGKQVAIKLLHADLMDADTISRFEREAKIASQLGHANIVAVHDFNVTADGTPYLVLEYLEGEALSDRLAAGPLPLAQILSIVRQIGSALAAAHRAGIVHRDLKPANIFLVPTEVDGRIVEIAKVLDFGISKRMAGSTVKTVESTLLGTPQYMAPEQAKGEHTTVDERTDVFAFGAIAYELLTGQPPFTGASIPEIVFKVVYEQPVPLAGRASATPPAVVAAVEKAMAKAQADRFPTVSAFVEAMTGQPITQTRGPAIAASLPPTLEFAETMGSGDHGGSPVSGHARTVASNPEITIPTAPAPAPPARRSPVVLAIAVVGGAAIAAGAMYLAMRGGAAPVPPVRDAAVAVVTSPPDAPPPVDAAPPPIDAAVAPKPAPPRPVPHRDPDEDDAGDASIASALADADAAMRARDYPRAERLANRIINDQRGTARQLARAHGVMGIVQCVARNNEERARIALRAIPQRFRPIRAQLIAACRAQGYLTE
jgi:eukaryotic-like serine/threonine-protein kinase